MRHTSRRRTRPSARIRLPGRTGSGALDFRVVGEPARPGPARHAVVLVHGIGMSHRYLTRLHDVLAADGDVWSVDLPGFGGLPKPGRDLDVTAMADALADVVSALDAGPLTLVGHSMGAQWVVELAVRRPELVANVVAIGAVADIKHRTLPAQLWALTVETLVESWGANAIVFTDYVRCGLPWYLTQLRHMLAYPIEVRVAQLEMRLLVIRGARDPIAGVAWCRLLRDNARKGALVQIPRRHHAAQHTSPRSVAGAIRAYTDKAAVAHG